MKITFELTTDFIIYSGIFITLIYWIKKSYEE